jgi:hypothetical protein
MAMPVACRSTSEAFFLRFELAVNDLSEESGSELEWELSVEESIFLFFVIPRCRTDSESVSDLLAGGGLGSLGSAVRHTRKATRSGGIMAGRSRRTRVSG